MNVGTKYTEAIIGYGAFIGFWYTSRQRYNLLVNFFIESELLFGYFCKYTKCWAMTVNLWFQHHNRSKTAGTHYVHDIRTVGEKYQT